MNKPQKYANTLPREHRNTPWHEEYEQHAAMIDVTLNWLVAACAAVAATAVVSLWMLLK